MHRKLPILSTVMLILAAWQMQTIFVAAEEKASTEVQKVTTSKDAISSLKQGQSPISGRSTRVLFITQKDCPKCEQELAKLKKPGGEFEKMRSIGWKIGDDASSHIQIVDRSAFPDVVEQLGAKEFPTVACVSDGEIVRSFKDGCTTPLDAWTFGWLIKGQNERPQPEIPEAVRVETTGNYRLRGNHWTLEGDANPSKQSVINHLRGPNHAHASASYGAIENWSYEELRSLHDDLHEREGGTVGNFAPAYQGAPAANRSLDAFSGGRKVSGR